MSAKAKLVALLAPVAPPCFPSRSQWVTYLQSAAEAQKATKLFDDSSATVLVLGEDGKHRFNPGFSMCRDCAAKHHLDMLRAGKCRPRHLIETCGKTAEVVA